MIASLTNVQFSTALDKPVHSRIFVVVLS